jgi:hypothetical protein
MVDILWLKEYNLFALSKEESCNFNIQLIYSH